MPVYFIYSPILIRRRSVGVANTFAAIIGATEKPGKTQIRNEKLFYGNESYWSTFGWLPAFQN